MVWVVVILISLVIFGIAFAVNKSKKDELMEEGKIIERQGGFYEQSELFTTISSYEAIRDELLKKDYSEIKVTVYPNQGGQRAILFKSGYAWNATLTYQGTTEDGRNKFRFAFSAWKERNGIPYNTFSMNIMTTTVEKVVLGLDPAATVENHKMQLNSKAKFL